MADQTYTYQKISGNHVPLFGNYYVADNENQIIGIMIVSKTNDELYLVKFFDLDKNSPDVTSYFQGNLQGNNANFDWITTKLLLGFLDQLLDLNLQVSSISKPEELFHNSNEATTANLYKLQVKDFNNVGFIKEMPKEDDLEMVSKLLHNNAKTHQLGDGPFVEDLTDSQVYLLDTLFDNE